VHVIEPAATGRAKCRGCGRAIAAAELRFGVRLRAEAERGVAHRRLPRVDGAERDPSGRARCRACREAIAKGTWRIPLVFFEDGRFEPAGFVHACWAGTYFETVDLLPRVRRFAPDLRDEDLAGLVAEMTRAAGA